MCPNGAGKVFVEKGYMEFSLFKKIVDEVHPHISSIILAMGGESFLHPDLFEMIAYAQIHGIKVFLNTNATLLDAEKTEQLFDSDLSYISFAFDGYNKSLYEKVRRGADYEKTLNNIIRFLRLKKERRLKNPYTVLSMLEINKADTNPDEKMAFVEQFKGLVDDIHFREVSSWGRVFKDSDDLIFRKYEDHIVPCGRLWNTLAVAWNGDVVPCSYHLNHEYVVVDIKNESLRDIWNSSKLTDLRKAMLNGDYLELSPLCENCTIAGTPLILGIPAGLRATLTDSLVNFLGFGFQNKAIKLANIFRRGKFASRTIK